uniref:Uncharacterized protein n=1 Tax=Melanopsichium pennsylvanicum 4 TaxID=1398559 RepID=A0A077R2M4_9BASI|nr:putative protein [Melanopsichium pennsylvanicum 4]
MSASSWAAAGPSRPTAASFAAVPKAALAKKKRGRFSDGNSKSKNSDLTNSIPSIVNPPSPELVPRHSSSASSWGIEDLSDSDGDYDWPTSSAALSSAATTNATLDASPDLDRDELARFARPAKRVHLETPDDRHTYGKLAGLQIDPTFMSSSSTPNQHYFFGRPHNARSNSGIAGAFGLGPSVTAAFEANTDGGMTSSPRVPPSSPTKSEAISALFQSSASTFYQQAVAPAPPTSPSMTSRGIAPPSSPLPPPPPQQQQQQSFNRLTLPSTRSSFADLKDSDMRLRRGVPSSYEVEPDRIVVTSLDDTSSSESGDGSIAETGEQQTADADTLPETKDSSSDFVINNELIEKLEAHSRAVLTGTSDRDNNAASTSSRSGKSAGSSRSRRSGRRSAGGSAIPGLGPLLSSRHRSTQSSPASSGYASPINAEDVRGALILWKDPEEVLKATATTYTNSITTTSSPLKQNENATVPESDVVTSGFMTQPPVSFQSGGSNHFSSIPGMAALARKLRLDPRLIARINPAAKGSDVRTRHQPRWNKFNSV